MKAFAAFLFVSAFVVSGNAQSEASSPQPKPTPTPKRRTFDQFDLGGLRVSGSPVREEPWTPMVSEPLDENTYELMLRLADNVAVAEAEYRSASTQNIDPNYRYSPVRILQKKLVGVYRVIEVHRTGMFGQTPLKNEHNLSLLKRSQDVIDEMMLVMSSATNGPIPNTGQIATLSEKYLPRLPEERKRVAQDELLLAMLDRLNKNFTRLKSQIVIAR